MIKGIAASNGIAIAKAYKLDMPDLTVTRFKIIISIQNNDVNCNQEDYEKYN